VQYDARHQRPRICRTSSTPAHVAGVTLFGRHELNLAFQLKTFRGPSVFDLVFVEVKSIALCLSASALFRSCLSRYSARAHAVWQVIQQLSAESMGDFLNSKNFRKFQDNQVTCCPRCCSCQWRISCVRRRVTVVCRRGEPPILL
jgi:hypothetical protein